ncbi:hypothetical protein ABK905_00450 [Acerihabitans sp. KWT182]|uniref:Radical SAM protein n=1 Tax=Acerihabitans sp. KWT182 TaxID=3157919 RepID=A0AAU7Q9R9_9GAMM
MLEQIITAAKKNFDVSKLKDISFEGSPLTLCDLEYVKSLKQLGINRVSFGVQTFDEKIRRTF